jgi:hypothetical protein
MAVRERLRAGPEPAGEVDTNRSVLVIDDDAVTYRRPARVFVEADDHGIGNARGKDTTHERSRPSNSYLYSVHGILPRIRFFRCCSGGGVSRPSGK